MRKLPQLSLFVALTFLVVFSEHASAETRKMAGRIIGYIPWPHILKMASFVENQEIVIMQLDSKGKKPELVKIVFTSFGPEQLPSAQLEGRKLVVVKAKRTNSCDERSPKFFAHDEPLIKSTSSSSEIQTVPLEQKYRQSEAFSSEPLNLYRKSATYVVISSSCRPSNGKPYTQK